MSAASPNRIKFTPAKHPIVYEIDEEVDEAPRPILLVEDDTDFSSMLKEYLETYNYTVTVAADGVQGMKRVMEQPFDLVICDLLMPNLPGDMFYLGVERVKPRLAKRFIFITGHQNDPKVADFIKRTKSLALFKPFDMRLLLDTIQVALKKKNKPAH
jgi:two-component system nitrogen regulation response regulator NtrX